MILDRFRMDDRVTVITGAGRGLGAAMAIVVNNVGGALPMPVMMTSDEFLEEAFHFNVTTALALTRAAVPHLLEQEGAAVLNISSAMGRLSERGYLAHGTAKAALAHMTRLLATDLAPRIRVNGLAVGSVLTSAREIVAGNKDLRNELETSTPLKRLGDPQDIAASALWLCSDAGSCVTGKVVEVDGRIEYPNLRIPLPDLEPGNF